MFRITADQPPPGDAYPTALGGPPEQAWVEGLPPQAIVASEACGCMRCSDGGVGVHDYAPTITIVRIALHKQRCRPRDGISGATASR